MRTVLYGFSGGVFNAIAYLETTPHFTTAPPFSGETTKK